MTREEFNEKYEIIVKEISKLDNSNETFNIFKILGLTDYEIRHSNFLAWLLKNEMFFKEFIELYNEAAPKAKKISDKTFNKEIRIKREEHFEEVNKEGKPRFTLTEKNQTICRDGYEAEGYSYFKLIKDNGKVDEKPIDGKEYLNKNKASWKNGRSIDLNIIGDDFTITIENKIDSGEHDFQCIAYRNYVENKEEYIGKKHYYVFLGKEIPVDFDTDVNRGLYPEYVFIKYTQIRDILLNPEKDFCFDNIQKVIVNHYCSVINEWEEIPEIYVNCFKEFEKENDLSDFYDEKKIQDIRKLDLNSEEKRFVELAYSYYKKEKEYVDSIIKPALKEACIDSNMINNDYNGGKYAVAIFLPDDKFDVFQSIDYRGPMDGVKVPSIGIFAGLKIPYSKALCKLLSKDKFLDKLKGLKEWSIELSLYFKNGSGFNINPNEITCDFDIFKNIEKEREREKILNAENVGRLSAFDMFNNDFVGYLLGLKNNDLFKKNDFSKGIKELIEYFTREKKKINDVKSEMVKILKKNDWEKDFANCKRNKWNENEIRTLSPNIEEEQVKILVNAMEIALFKQRYKKELEILKDSEKELLKYECCSVCFGWNLVLKYVIKDFDEKYKNDINALKALFIEKTLEGVAPFGDEYKDWYKTEVFQN